MLDALKTFLSDFHAGGKTPDRFGDDDYRLSAAALLVHTMTIDGEPKPQERETLRKILKARFELDDEGADQLIEAAIRADSEAVDLYHFTSQLNRALDDDGRRRMVEMMWEMVYADGSRSEFEDNLVWRMADLLGVSSRDRILLRGRADAARGGG